MSGLREIRNCKEYCHIPAVQYCLGLSVKERKTCRINRFKQEKYRGGQTYYMFVLFFCNEENDRQMMI